jgi:uncharacterized membrane protein
MPIARLLLIAVILCSPATLPWDGLIAQGALAGVVALILAITGWSLRPGETAFLISVIRPLALIASVLALWIVFQVLPLRVLANPIWKSAEEATRSPLWGAVSIDPGASVIALGKYVLLCAIAFLSAAVAVDRQRAGSILSAMIAAVAAIALITLVSVSLPNGRMTELTRTQAIDLTGLGL